MRQHGDTHEQTHTHTQSHTPPRTHAAYTLIPKHTRANTLPQARLSVVGLVSTLSSQENVVN